MFEKTWIDVLFWKQFRDNLKESLAAEVSAIMQSEKVKAPVPVMKSAASAERR